MFTLLSSVNGFPPSVPPPQPPSPVLPEGISSHPVSFLQSSLQEFLSIQSLPSCPSFKGSRSIPSPPSCPRGDFLPSLIYPIFPVGISFHPVFCQLSFLVGISFYPVYSVLSFPLEFRPVPSRPWRPAWVACVISSHPPPPALHLDARTALSSTAFYLVQPGPLPGATQPGFARI